MRATEFRARWSRDELEDLRRVTRRFFTAEAVMQVERWEAQHHVDRAFWTRAGELGLICPSVPDEYGGAGGTFFHEAVLCEEQARAMVSGWGHAVHSIVAHYLLAYASDEQKARWLPPMLRGKLVGAIAMTEAGAGSDLQSIRTRAERDGDHYLVNGSKTFITNGALADLVVLAVKTDPSAGAKGMTLLVVETAGLDGFERGQPLRKVGMNAQDTTELFFRDARVPVAHRLGAEGEGFAQLMRQLPLERLLIAIGAIGSMERALDETIAYVKERKLFGTLSIDLQHTRFTLAECKTRWRVARAFLDECIERQDRGELDSADAAMAKWWCTDQQGRVIDDCVQLFGGYGYIVDYPIARLYAEARVTRIYGGANELMKELIARGL